PAPPPLPPAPVHAPPAEPRSLPALSDTRGSSPDHHCAPQTRCFRLPTISQGPRSCTSALRPPPHKGSAQTAPRLPPPASDIRALIRILQYLSLPALLPAQPLPADPRHAPAYSVWDDRSGPLLQMGLLFPANMWHRWLLRLAHTDSRSPHVFGEGFS